MVSRAVELGGGASAYCVDANRDEKPQDDSTRGEGETGLVLPIQRPGTALEDRGSPSPIVPVCDMFRVNGKWNLPRLLKKKQTLVLISFDFVSVIELIVSRGWLWN